MEENGLSIDISEGIEPGNLKIKVLTTNDTSATLQTNPKFKEMVVQPGPAAAAFIGEHGLAVYIEFNDGSTTHAILFDTGGVNSSILHNANPMSIKLSNCEHVIISHGHFDHTGSLAKLIPTLNAGSDIIIHPLAYIQNQVAITRTGEDIPLEDFVKSLRELKKSGQIILETKLPAMDKNAIESAAVKQSVKLVETTQPSALYPGIATSGEIELFDPSEVTPGFYLLSGKNQVEKHTFRDEIALYFNVNGKGLVVLTGCGHAGINNIIRHGQKLTGIDTIYAIIGGFHTEMTSGPNIDTIIEHIEAFNPRIVCGMHCTGLQFQAKMLGHDAHVQGVTGTEFRL